MPSECRDKYLKIIPAVFSFTIFLLKTFSAIMNQPELGKKIAELRKAKGLTQDELVSMCNLNVRTLQRIESGEVTPRSFTIKAIFTALDYNIYDGLISTDSTTKTETSEFSRLEQIYRYVFDLFNLKTNTMKKLLILSTIAICMVFLFTGMTSAQSTDTNKLIGTWQLCDANGNMTTTGSARMKIISSESFVVTEVDQNNKFYNGYFLGTYTFEKDVYTETINYTSSAMYQYKGVKNSFKVEFKGDLMYVKGIGNSFNEIWKRVKS
jgi:transcriptional regulator with XRE-family HTH domain